MQNPGTISTHSGRKSGGKRIDTWTFRRPDHDTIVIHVSLASGDDGITLHAETAEQSIIDQSWADTDISRLRDTVERDIADTLAHASSDKWRHAIAIETRPARKTRNQKTAGLSLTFTDVLVDVSDTSRNDGARRVMIGPRIDTMVERSLDEERPDDRMSGMVLETPHALAILETNEGHEQVVEAIEATIDAFTRRFAQRLGPDGLLSGLPTPRDIALLMRQAADEVEERALPASPR